MESLSDEELQEIRTFDIDGEKIPYSYGELLAHVALHERGHHGDVTTLFSQLGIEADAAFEYRFLLGRSRTRKALAGRARQANRFTWTPNGSILDSSGAFHIQS